MVLDMEGAGSEALRVYDAIAAAVCERIPPGCRFVLVDEARLHSHAKLRTRSFYPFMERGGSYWGPPPDDETAIREVERLRARGASHVVFCQPAFWWLDYYSGLREHLRSHYRCVLDDDTLVLFDLLASAEDRSRWRDKSRDDLASLRLTRLNEEPKDLRPGLVAAFMKVRNEMLRLPYCLEYHRQLGVHHFFVVDNDSNDGTREWLLKQRDVTCFFSDLPLAKCDAGAKWYNVLLDRYGEGRWCLVIDADELFVYPECESLRLDAYGARLDAAGVDGVLSILIDMYANSSISDVEYRRGDPFLSSCRFFDGEGYETASVRINDASPRQMVRGGMRKRVFYENGGGLPPVLSKIALVRWKPGMRFWCSNHSLKPEIRLSGFQGALLHFRFFSDFVEKVGQEVRTGNKFRRSEEPRAYLKRLGECPELNPYSERSREYTGSQVLVDLGLMRGPKPDQPRT